MKVCMKLCILLVASPNLWVTKNPKTGTPLRPIESSRGSVTYGVAKVLAKVLKPLVG